MCLSADAARCVGPFQGGKSRTKIRIISQKVSVLEQSSCVFGSVGMKFGRTNFPVVRLTYTVQSFVRAISAVSAGSAEVERRPLKGFPGTGTAFSCLGRAGCDVVAGTLSVWPDCVGRTNFSGRNRSPFLYFCDEIVFLFSEVFCISWRKPLFGAFAGEPSDDERDTRQV